MIGQRRIANGLAGPAVFGIAAACAALALLVGCALARAAVVPPAADPFYTAPADIQHDPNGAILHERSVSMSGPQQARTAVAHQLLFRTTDATGRPTVAATTVLVPKQPAPGPRRLATYETFEDSLTLNCAPSYTLQGGNDGGGTNGPTEEAMIAQLLAQGWEVNVPDTEGPNSEWAVGPMLGHATLDAIRAAEHFRADGLEGTRTKVTLNGYSGGAEEATWAAALAPRYAPKLRIVGVAAGGNFPDLDVTMSRFDGSVWYGTEIGVMESFSRAFPQLDLNKLLNSAGRALAAKDGRDADGCAGSVLNTLAGNASLFTNFRSSQALAADPVVKRVLDRISLRFAPRPRAPLFLYNASTDELAYIKPVDALVANYCGHGLTVDYDRDPQGLNHVHGLVRYWPPTLRYLRARFAGRRPPDNCH